MHCIGLPLRCRSAAHETSLPPFNRRPPAGASRELRPCQDRSWSSAVGVEPGAQTSQEDEVMESLMYLQWRTRSHPNCCYLATQQHVQVTRVSIYSVRPQEEAGEAVSPHGMMHGPPATS